MEKRHREVMHAFGIKSEKNRPDQTPVEHIEHARSQDDLPAKCNNVGPTIGRPGSVSTARIQYRTVRVIRSHSVLRGVIGPTNRQPHIAPLVPHGMRCYSVRMRRVGELSNETEARTFHDALLSRGIENTAEAEDGGGIMIWVHDDDQITEAARLFALFRSAPDSPEFREATTKAAVIRAELKKSERRRRSTVIDEARIGYERNFLSEGWVSILFLVLSLAVTFYTDFFANEKAMRLIQISQVPYIRELPGGGSLFLPEIKAGEVWRLITPIFAHGSVMHILFNMMWLVQLGRFIESRFGAAKLLALIMAVAVGSNLGEYLWKSPYFGGMSGVNYGLFGFLWMKGKFDRSQNWQLPVQTVQLMLMWMVLCYTGLMGPVANAAHTVGLIIGALWGLGSARLVPWLERSSR